jgi:probable HAF family extracellular repeat protein
MDYNTPPGAYQAATWLSGKESILGALLTGGYSDALGIDAAGDVVGESAVAGTNASYYYWHAFLWHNSALNDLGTLPGGQNSVASGINAGMQVVGWSDLAANDTHTHAFLWQSGKITDLGTLPGGITSDASAINDAGQIVGSADSPPQGIYSFRAVRPVLWDSTGIHDLGTLGGPGGIAFGINSAGQIVGTADTTVLNTNPPPFGSSTGGGTGGASGNGGGTHPGSGNPISGGAGRGVRAGRAGKSTLGIGDVYLTHAFLYTNGAMSDLNTFLPANSGWVLNQATGINAQGSIVGFGTFNTNVHAFLLTPK